MSSKSQYRKLYIKARLLIHLSARNLVFKRLRSVLTIAGVVIGTSSVFLLLSFGLGLQGLVKDRIIGASSMNAVTVTSANSRIVKLDEAAIDRLSQIPEVSAVGKTYSKASKVHIDSANTDAVMYGLDEVALELNGLRLEAGRLLDTNKPEEVTINTSLLEKVGINSAAAAVGKNIDLTVARTDDAGEDLTQQFVVTGVIASSAGAEAFVSEDIFEGVADTYPSQVKLVASDQKHIDSIRTAAEAAGFTTSSPLDTLAQINQVFRIFNIILVGFGSVGMIIAILGMFNTLTISLLERTREIGLMVALGARQKDMRLLFISEALLISVVGGLIGIAGAIGLGFLIDRFFNYISASRGATVQDFSLFAEPLWLLGASLLFMLVLGYAVVYLPAKRAASINPIDALRHE